MKDIKPADIKRRYSELYHDAEQSGYHLNPDKFFTDGLITGLLVNRERYGYESCPCRLSKNNRKLDADIICPCDYRDPDLNEFGACYCGLYVSEMITKQNLPTPVIPERRFFVPDLADVPEKNITGNLQYPVWRCRVCGYLCARTLPPEKCPICKAEKDRFELFKY